MRRKKKACKVIFIAYMGFIDIQNILISEI
jgi:hypothetical protein